MLLIFDCFEIKTVAVDLDERDVYSCDLYGSLE